MGPIVMEAIAVVLLACISAINCISIVAGEKISLKIEGEGVDQVLSGNCSLYELHKKPRRITKENNKYGLWPDLMSETDLETGETLFGMEEAMEMIWRNQNPPDCRKAKYLVLDAWNQGYGSEIHLYGAGLGVALDMGYVAVYTGGWTWRFKNKFCKDQGQKTLDCYYAPFSKCTLEDAMHVAYPNGAEEFKKKAETATHHWSAEEDRQLVDLVKQFGKKGQWIKISESLPVKTSVQCYKRWHEVLAKNQDRTQITHDDIPTISEIITDNMGIYPLNLITRVQNVKGRAVLHPAHSTLPTNVLVVHREVYNSFRKFVPHMFVPMLQCTKMDPKASYLWWRTISTTYFIRPNNATLALLEKERDSVLRDVRGKCISTYIRHGDKASEMQLVPTKNYLDTAMRIWNETLSSQLQTAPQKVFYIASEDFQAIEEARAWGIANQIAVRQSNMSQTVLSDKRQVIQQRDMERQFPKSREMEYFSYILHLADTVYCEASICTWPSNYCRVIDELRTTVGGKANKIFADLSSETCPSGPPCIRNYGLGNFQGNFSDPFSKLWR